MSRWVTFYCDMLFGYVSDFKVHPDRETALKYFNRNCKNYFQLNTRFKADKLPASYGNSLRKYYGISARAFKEGFKISVDEALQIVKEKENERDKMD